MVSIGNSPTPATVSSLVRTCTDEEIKDVIDQVLRETDGPILTNLVANLVTREKVVKVLTADKIASSFELLKTKSDPKFVALSWLADEVKELRDPILKLIEQEPMSKSSLTVYARLLTKQKLDVKALKDSVVHNIVLWLQPDPKDAESQHWETLATVLVSAAASTHAKVVTDFVKETLENHKNKGYDAAFAAIGATNELFPQLADLVWELPTADSASPAPAPTDDLFRMLSRLANSKDNREKVQKKFGDIVAAEVEGGNTLAAVVQAKLYAGTTSQTGDVEAAATKLDELSQKFFEVNLTDVTLEGLACTASLVSTRNRIAEQSSKDSGSVIPQLVKLLKANPGTLAYAILAILVQLSKFPIKPTNDELEKSQLRIKTLGKSILDIQEETDLSDESRKHTARELSGKICDKVLASGLLPFVVLNATKFSPAAHEQLAYLLRELTGHQEKHRREKLASQGAAVIAMYLWALDKPHKLDPRVRSVAASTIAKILATVSPRAGLTGKVAETVVVPPLCLQIHNEHSDRPNLETFEALRALTNLASADDLRLRNTISRFVWPHMTAALNSEFLQIRRASLELICNLMTVSSSAEHFLQNDPTSKALLSLLGSSLLVDDRDSRLAAAGSIALLSEWETAPEYIGHNNDCIEGMTGALGKYPTDDDLLLRVLVALNTIIKVTSKDLDDEVVEQIVFNQGLTHLEELVDTLDPAEHSEVAKLVLQCIKLLAIYKAKTK